MSGYISENIYSLEKREQELCELNQRTLENIQIEIKNIINLALNATHPNKLVNALHAVESLSNTCNNDIRRYQDTCKELINAEKEKCQNEVDFIKQQQDDTDNSLERKILSNYITNRNLNRKSYWKSFQYLTNSDSVFVNKSPRNITAADLLVTNVDSFHKQELRLQEQITKLINEMTKIKNERDGLEDNLAVINSKLQATLIQKEDAEDETKILLKKLDDFRKTYDDKVYECKELENQLEDEKTKCSNLEQQCQELTQQIDDQHDVVVSNLNEQVRELTDQCQQYEKEKRKVTLDYELSVQNYNSLVEKTDQDIAYKNKELTALNTQLKSESELVEKLTTENKKLLFDLDNYNSVTEQFKTLRENYDKVNNEFSTLNVNYLELKKTNDQYQDTIVKKNNNISSLKNYLNEVVEKNELLEKKLEEVLSKWNEERNRLIAKNINHRNSMIDVSSYEGSSSRDTPQEDTVFFNDQNQLMIKDVNLIENFESSETRKEMLHEIEKYKEEINATKNLYLETDTKYKDCMKKLEDSEQSLQKMEEANTKLEKRVEHVKEVYSSMVEAIQTQSRIKIDNLSEKLDYTTECLEDTKRKNSELQLNLKENVSDEMNKMLLSKEAEIENLRSELQQFVSETNRNDFMERENQLKEKIRELEAMISSNEISWNKQSEELKLVTKKNIELQQIIEDTNLLLKSKEEQEEDHLGRIDSLEKSLEKAKKNLEEKEKVLTQNNNEFNDIQSQYQHFNDRVKELSTKLDESTQIVDHLKEENKNCQMDLLKKEEEVKALQQKLEDYQSAAPSMANSNTGSGNNTGTKNSSVTSNPVNGMNGMNGNGGNIILGGNNGASGNGMALTNEPESFSPGTPKSPEDFLKNDSIKKLAMVDRELSRRLSHANHEEIVQSLSGQIFKLYTEMDKIETEKINITEEYEEMKKEKVENEATLNKQLDEVRKELEINKETLNTLRKKFAAVEEETNGIKMENDSLKRELERCQLKLENTNKKMLTMMEEHEEALKQKDEKYEELYKLNNQLREKYNRFIALLKQKGVL